MSYQMVRG